VTALSRKTARGSLHKKCDKSTEESSKESEYGKENLVVISKGSRPVSLDDWANGEDFVPVPLKVVIEPMENLLTPENFEPDSCNGEEECYGIPQGIDVDKLKIFFREQNQQHCVKFLGLSQTACKAKYQGSHITSNLYK